jgi:hypothetical protein
MDKLTFKIKGQTTVTLSLDRIMEAVQADDMIGFCLSCGEEQRPVEPDGRRQLCESCGKRYVYGAEEILLRSVA